MVEYPERCSWPQESTPRRATRHHTKVSAPVVTSLDGNEVIAVANPLRSLSADAAYVSGLLKTIPGPVILVGHSYGGAVINNAAVGNDNVKALVLVAGLAPDQGESAADLVGKFPGATLGAARGAN